MKTIADAIRPRKGKLSSDSAGSPGPPTRQPVYTLGKPPSKLSVGDELTTPFAHFRTHSSSTTADSATADDETASMAFLERDECTGAITHESTLLANTCDTAEHLVTGATTVTGSATPAAFENDYQPQIAPSQLYDDLIFGDAPTMAISRRLRDVQQMEDTVKMPEQQQQQQQQQQTRAANIGNLVPEARGGLLSYVHRLPIHIWGFSRHADRVAQSEPPPATTTAAIQSNDTNGSWATSSLRPKGLRRRQQQQQQQQQHQQEHKYRNRPESPLDAPSIHSESVMAPSNSGFFGGDYGLLKRVSSTPGNLSLFRAHLVDPFSHPEFRAPPRYTRHQPIRLPANEPDNTPIYGCALLALTSLIFIFSMYSLVVSKFMPDTGIAFLDAVKEDRYFCLLMPITGLSFTFAVFWNWLGMKFFRHN